MMEHHKRAIDKLVEYISKDDTFLAAITSGSIAKGAAKESSDIDVYLVVTDEEYKRRTERHENFFYNKELCDYEGGYIDGKVVDYRFVSEAAVRGTEPTRASFIGSKVVYSRIPDLDAIVEKIPVYQEHERERKIKSFYAQVHMLGGYFTKQAYKYNDTYLLYNSLSNLVLFAGRLILAHNRILFPGHKWFLDFVEQADEKPEGFRRMAEELLKEPDTDKIKAFVKCIKDFRNWNVAGNETVCIFMEDIEWNWVNGSPSPQDW